MVYIVRNPSNERIGVLTAEKDELKNAIELPGQGEIYLVKAGDEKSLISKPVLTIVEEAALVVPELATPAEPIDATANALRSYFGLSASADVVAYISNKLTKAGTPRKKPVTAE